MNKSERHARAFDQKIGYKVHRDEPLFLAISLITSEHDVVSDSIIVQRSFFFIGFRAPRSGSTRRVGRGRIVLVIGGITGGDSVRQNGLVHGDMASRSLALTSRGHVGQTDVMDCVLSVFGGYRTFSRRKVGHSGNCSLALNGSHLSHDPEKNLRSA